MKTLSSKVYVLIASAINTIGTYEPSKISFLFEENLTSKQYDSIIPFLQWCHDTGKMFGSYNYQERYQEFLKINC